MLAGQRPGTESRRPGDPPRARTSSGPSGCLHDAEANVHRLFHGNTLHGPAEPRPEAPRRALDLLHAIRSDRPALRRRSGPRLDAAGLAWSRSSGLGAGTLACYARPGQRWTFYEIDPAVVRIARGPAVSSPIWRTPAARESASRSCWATRGCGCGTPPISAFGLIVLDAFSSDAVPVHLLSREAIRLYRTKLADRGAAGLQPVESLPRPRAGDGPPGRGRGPGLPDLLRRVSDDRGEARGEAAVDLGRDGRARVGPGSACNRSPLASSPGPPGARVWTDDYSDLASYLVLGGRRFPDPIAAPVDDELRRPNAQDDCRPGRPPHDRRP